MRDEGWDGRRQRTLLGALVLTTVLLMTAAAGARGAEPTRAPNVVFIVIDDLNDWVGHLGGNPASLTPNLDRLARRGVRFTHAYAAAPLCNPSRTAVLSGQRPSTTGVYSNAFGARNTVDPALMLTARFREAGYFVAGTGKVAHEDQASQWDEFYRYRGGDGATATERKKAAAGGEAKEGIGAQERMEGQDRDDEKDSLLGSGPSDGDDTE